MTESDIERQQRIADARQALDNPAVQRAFSSVEDRCLRSILAGRGSMVHEEWREHEAECCRELRTVKALRDTLTMSAEHDRIVMEQETRNKGNK